MTNAKLFNPDYLLHLCKKYGLAPSKKYGQNFLINQEVIEKIIEAGEINKNDTVVEVGPGFGVLTLPLAEQAGKVFSFEIEKKLQSYWENILGCHPRESGDPGSTQRTANPFAFPLGKGEKRMSRFRGNDSYKNLEIVWGNVLKEIERLKDLKIERFKVVANLPYQITSNVIRKFLEAENKPTTMVLMVQKEVAERICAKPGEMSVLAVAVQYYADPEIISIVSSNNFWPEPKVDSAIIKLTVHSAQSTDSGKEKYFFKLVKTAFAQKRKLLSKNLIGVFEKNKVKDVWKQMGLKDTVRAQELSVEDWKKMALLLE